MPTRHQSYGFDAEDRKVYSAWLRSTIVAYGAIVMLGIALVAVQATTRTADTPEFAATGITMTGP
jgi:uncharacterized membrane protein